MISQRKILNAIQEITTDFNGEIALKNSQRQYFFVNDNWLHMTQLERRDVIGKIDPEIFTPDTSMQLIMEDKKAIEKKLPAEYIEKISINNNPIIRIAMKWTVSDDSGNLFCICTLSVKPENKKIIYDVRKKVEMFFEKATLK